MITEDYVSKDYKKLYEDALERAKVWKDKSGMPKDKQGILDDIFPELTENDDERIRNEIIDYLERFIPHHEYDLVAKSRIWIDWLKKQGEQKPADKVEPKFNVGDWIVTPDNKVKQIEKVTFGNYWFTDESLYNIIDVDNKGHLWTIQDAKKGDILADNYSIIIFRKIGNEFWNDVIDYYISYSYSRGIIVQSCKSHYGIANKITFKPATKEQRDLLFSKMKEAGYEWDVKDKMLKKIEQNHAWSDEDETGLEDALWAIEQARTIAKDENDMGNLWYAERWLTSLKEKMKK